MKKEKMAALSKKDNLLERKQVELQEKVTQKKDAALEKREAHLRELRDRLQAQNKKAKQVKLKKLLTGPPVPVPLGRGTQVFVGKDYSDSFFD
ncbi:hypothetical protein Pmani_019613 [Petrolisthes manimaculis]|uniref:Uncharacterized protein n=1 Tax=Petrolisthes manimaculis TaxID=1843537 RepID=A0AAE1PFQ6_9EUCA|nr:hypothetical protein Pmani_021787 [Petrolisthes manimaculis]KAK4308699.1 hypothetical protein Pmani_019613 [Petrolisthes manimaculis]